MATIPTITGSVRIPTADDLRALAVAQGPCLSAYMPLKQGWMLERDVLDAARKKLHGQVEDIEAFLKPVTSAVDEAINARGSGDQSLAVFRTRDGMQQFRLPCAVEERICVASGFHVLPLVKCSSLANEFYVLALSQKHARLIHCSRDRSEEVVLPASAPTNLREFLQTDQPEHRLENRSSGGTGIGGGTVTFGTSADAERKDEYLLHYYNELDKQLQSFLRDRPLPMVVAGVDYERALYHRVSEYSNLVLDGVHGAADGLKGGELHARALVAVDAHLAKASDRALAQFEKAGADRILMQVQDVVRSAADGRVLHLFVAEGARQAGRFDAETREVSEEDGGTEDLLNLAALQTLARGGDVFVLPPEKIPGAGPIAASLRF